MKVTFVLQVLIGILVVLCSFGGRAEQQSPVVICIDSETQWPPYLYNPVAEDGTRQENKIIGATPELIDRVFRFLNIDYRIVRLPWTRALATLKDYKRFKSCEMSWDMSINDERKQWLWFSDPIYQVQSGVFYSKKKNPELPTLKGLFHIFSYTVCGLRGYDYSPVDRAVSMRLAREQQALDMVAKGRCDIFLSTIEPIVYGSQVGLYNLDDDIDYFSAKGFERTLYAVVSKQSPRARLLQSGINKAISRLKENGELEAIFKRHISTGTGL